MFLPAPQLDDTRWSDLVEQSRALLPVYAPEWTDHNVSDPGITLLDLLAWFAEMQVFQLDQVPERHRRAFLALVGVAPEPPRAARAVLRFGVAGGAAPVPLPAGVACEGTRPDGVPAGFRTLHPVQVVADSVAALTAVGPTGRLDLTAAWLRGDPVAPFGTDPQRGASVEIAFSEPLPPNVRVTLALSTRHGRDPAASQRHHDAEIVWEALAGASHWAPVDVVSDGTRALARDGRVELVLASRSQRLRVRYAWGAFDAAPWLRDVVLNGTDAEQATVITDVWALAPGATIVGSPAAGTSQPLGIEVDAVTGEITRLDVTAASAPSVRVLAYRAPTPATAGELAVAAKRLGTSTGDPGQAFELEPAPLELASVRIYAGHGPTWRRFHPHGDLLASGPADAHVVLDAETGRVTCGDGRHAVVPPRGHLVIAVARSTLADGGNVDAGTVDRIVTGAPAGVTVSQPLAAAGGEGAETLGQAEARAEQLTGATTRALTAADVETLVRATPGAEIARVAVLPDLHPAFPCVRAPGVVTAVVVPWLPAGRPVPSCGLRRAVAAQLAPRRLVGTRFEVAGPRYVSVKVVATLAARRLAVPADVRQRAVAALDAWLDPLTGGPTGTGWPFGRDVVRAEVLQVLDDVAGVDHVAALDLVGPDGCTCGNLCLGAIELADSGEHSITVVAA